MAALSRYNDEPSIDLNMGITASVSSQGSVWFKDEHDGSLFLLLPTQVKRLRAFLAEQDEEVAVR
jgi:hypothetical protein